MIAVDKVLKLLAVGHLILAVSCAQNSESEMDDDQSQQPIQTAPQPVQEQPAPQAYEPFQQAESWDSDVVIPPQEYYLAALKEQLKLTNKTGLLLTDEQLDLAKTLYVSFEGATLDFGFSKGKSFILCDSTVDFPAADLTEEQKESVMTMVQQYFDDAGALLNITTIEPEEDSAYTTIHVGGDMTSLGCKADENILGIAPLDKKDQNLNDIGYTFTGNIDPETYDIVYYTALVVAHEAGHTFGLSHIDNTAAVMASSVHEEVEGFGIGKAKNWFIFTTTQNGPEYLQDVLGPLSAEDGEEEGSEEEEEGGLKNSICNRVIGLQDFIKDNFEAFVDGYENYLEEPSICL